MIECVLPARRPHERAIDYLVRVRYERAPTRVVATKAAWSEMIQVSETQLQSAMDCGALLWTRRGIGRAHAVRLIDAGDLLHLLSITDAVHRGLVAPPEWWSSLGLATVTTWPMHNAVGRRIAKRRGAHYRARGGR